MSTSESFHFSTTVHLCVSMERIIRFLFGMLVLADVYSTVRVTQDNFFAIFTGNPVEIKCEHDDSSLLYMYWYRQHRGSGLTLVGTSVRGNDPTLEESFREGYEITRQQVLRSSLKILAGTGNDSATYFCVARTLNTQAYFGEGTRLIVLEEDVPVREPNVVLFNPSEQEIRQKKKATLVCLASNFYPGLSKITWSVNGVERTDGVKTDDDPTQGERSRMYSMSSRLRLSRKEWATSWKSFQCTVRIYYPTEKEIQKEIMGREECGLTEDSYKRHATSVKFTYVLLLCKAALYGLVVTGLTWTFKVNGKHFS